MGSAETPPWRPLRPEMSAPVQVAGFGAIALDDLIYVDGPLSAEKGRVKSRISAHGGNVATALVTVSALGGKASFIGWISDRPAFRASLDDLRQNGVETAHAPLHTEAAPVKSVITVGSGGERFIAFDDQVPIGTAPDLSLMRLAGATILLVDSYAVQSLAAVERARDAGLAIVADIEWAAGAATDRLIGLCDHLVLPWAFAEAATGKSDPQAMVEWLWSKDRSSVVLTRGGDGVVFRQRGDETLWHLPAHVVDVIDTTGAGDCFHGAYAQALATGATLKECVSFGNAAAALSTTAAGARGFLPGEKDVFALLASEGAPKATPL